MIVHFVQPKDKNLKLDIIGKKIKRISPSAKHFGSGLLTELLTVDGAKVPRLWNTTMKLPSPRLEQARIKQVIKELEC